MSFSEYSFASSAHQRPDKPLIVKCTFDRSMRRITFASAQNCSFDLLRTRVEQCFSLYASSFVVTYKDDDGEVTDITCDDDLTEAIQYFHLGDDNSGPALSSGASSYSGRSSSSTGGSRKITLRVDVNVDYDGPSLSDTASLSSLEEYKEKRSSMGSEIDLDGSISSGMSGSRREVEYQALRGFGRELGELEDDTMTISSRPTTIAQQHTGPSQGVPRSQDTPRSQSTPKVNGIEASNAASMVDSIASTESFSLLKPVNDRPKLMTSTSQLDPSALLTPPVPKSAGARTPVIASPSDVFQRLKLAETAAADRGGRSPTNVASSASAGSGMAGWLKQQSIQMVQSVLGGLPTAPSSKASSEADGLLVDDRDERSSSAAFSSSGVGAVEEDRRDTLAASDIDEIPGSLELELERNERGAYYYTYTGSSIGHSTDDHEKQPLVRGDRTTEDKRFSYFTASSMESNESPAPPPEDPGSSSLEFLQYLPPDKTHEPSIAAPNPAELTDCSSCGQVLDTFRYVCATCGPRPPRALTAAASSSPASDPDPTSKGKGRAPPTPIVPPTPISVISPTEASHSPTSQQMHVPLMNAYNFAQQTHDHVQAYMHGFNGGPPFSHNHRVGHHPGHGAQFTPVLHHPLGAYAPSNNGSSDGGWEPITYPPPQRRPSHSYTISPSGLSVWTRLDSQSNFASSRNGSTTSLQHNKPLPSVPQTPAHPSPHRSPLLSSPQAPPAHSSPGRSPISPRHGSGSQHSESSSTTPEGFELCTDCMETAGIEHASESVATIPTPGVTPTHSSPGSAGSGSFTDANPLSNPGPATGSGSSSSSADSGSWRRNVPRRKGQLRHAFKEKMWGAGGWTDLEHDGLSKCSTCGSGLTSERYKCATCLDMVVCRGCYSQIHEIHPIHAFLILPEAKRSEPASEPADAIEPGERSLLHDGLKCSHCLMEIVGARFHCAICPSVDICSNCESAGLPGNLTSPDGGHDSSHIMIKVPFPLSANEIDTASRRALLLWTGRDAPSAQSNQSNLADGSGSGSSYAATIVGSSNNSSDFSRDGSHRMDHGMNCKGCGSNIIGVRYQCAGCPSPDGQGYSLCVNCEARSYRLHDPMHCFFKIPRPVDRKIQEEEPLVPSLYILAAGEFLDDPPLGSQNDPRAYLQTIVHRVALCDRCIQRIVGEWFHCAYCAKDLCDNCEAMDSHDASHLFVVFKSVVDMTVLRTLTDVDNPQAGRPLIPHPVYTRPL
ncbi:hypothetical protein M408DRAFT_326470 [Serendipita vermifera MAFF 305830]|uniref:ZZ-type domain-containing protein n=1 Tax=Serendipita vermifera MAFF 305830 TaxID=933852 RepID=A0A0C3B7C6_SERVB|nr:hypothetical protein M408DRAFT_326470 [Serendipita vermifera MAFF 305830]